MKKNIIKILSLILISAFVSYDITWAQGGIASLRDLPKPPDPAIPYDLGKIQYSHSNGGDEKIINIQDAHASLSAQHSIVKILDCLAANYDLNLIAVEGSEGYVDTSILRTFPDETIRKKTAEYLMERGMMSAGEFFSIVSNKPVALYGVDDNELYKKNVEALKAVMDDRAACVNKIYALERALRKLEPKIYSENMRKLMDASSRHREGSSSFSQYWAIISDLNGTGRIDLTGYGNISKLVSSIELEKSIDFTAANAQRKGLIDELSKKMSKGEIEALALRTLDFKNAKASSAEFHEYLINLAKDNNIELSRYKNLTNYAEYVRLYENIDIVKLHLEVEKAEDAIRQRLFTSEDDAALYDLQKKLEILKGLFNVSLTNEGFEYLVKHKDKYTREVFENFINTAYAKYALRLNDGFDLNFVLERMGEAIGFYEMAQERNNALLVNTIMRMRDEKQHVAALITGGFHSQGIDQLVKDKGLAYLVIMPKFDAGIERPYITILTNKKAPYEGLIKSGQYNLAIHQYYSTGDLGDLVYSVALALGEVKDEDLGSAKKTWAANYRFSHESLSRVRSAASAAERLNPGEFDRLLDSFTSEALGEIGKVESQDLTGSRVLEIIKYQPGKKPTPKTLSSEKIPLEALDDYGALSKRAADIVVETLKEKPSAVIGLTCGNTPIGMYEELVRRYEAGEVDYSQATFVQPDNYLDLDPNHRQSYRTYLNEMFFSKVGVDINGKNVHLLEPGDKDPAVFAGEYEAYLDEHPIDLLILGMGGGYYDYEDGVIKGGHIGFNEPGSDKDTVTRVVDLAGKTRLDAAYRFGGIEKAPKKALTLGIRTILKAKVILLLVSGEDKAPILKAAVEGDITPDVPASFLQAHDNTLVLVDKGAALALKRESTPWEVPELRSGIDWSEMNAGAAADWLAAKCNKNIDELRVKDFEGNGLGPLIRYYNDDPKNLYDALRTKVSYKIADARLPYGKTIAVFSPHPDDDVASCGGIIQKLRKNENTVIVIYMTSGALSVKGANINTEEKKNKRETEARQASERLDYEPVFLDLPFYYERGDNISVSFGADDVKKVREVLEKYKPDIIFKPGELNDPNGTHGVCDSILTQALKEASLPDIETWLYRGAWSSYSIYDENLAIVSLDANAYLGKEAAVRAHKTQEILMFPGPDSRTLMTRIAERTESNMRQLRRLHLFGSDTEYVECFQIEKAAPVARASTSGASMSPGDASSDTMYPSQARSILLSSMLAAFLKIILIDQIATFAIMRNIDKLKAGISPNLIARLSSNIISFRERIPFYISDAVPQLILLIGFWMTFVIMTRRFSHTVSIKGETSYIGMISGTIFGALASNKLAFSIYAPEKINLMLNLVHGLPIWTLALIGTGIAIPVKMINYCFLAFNNRRFSESLENRDRHPFKADVAAPEKTRASTSGEAEMLLPKAPLSMPFDAKSSEMAMDGIKADSFASLKNYKGKIIVIGGSAHGYKAIQRIIEGLPQDHPPIIIAEHLSPTIKYESEFLNFVKHSGRNIIFCSSPEERYLERGMILVSYREVTISKDEHGWPIVVIGCKPYIASVDDLFISAAKYFGRDVISVVVSGVGNDGRKGAMAVHENQGIVLAQLIAEGDSEYCSSMPWFVIESDIACESCVIDDMSTAIMKAVDRDENISEPQAVTGAGTDASADKRASTSGVDGVAKRDPSLPPALTINYLLKCLSHSGYTEAVRTFFMAIAEIDPSFVSRPLVGALRELRSMDGLEEIFMDLARIDASAVARPLVRALGNNDKRAALARQFLLDVARINKKSEDIVAGLLVAEWREDVIPIADELLSEIGMFDVELEAQTPLSISDETYTKERLAGVDAVFSDFDGVDRDHGEEFVSDDVTSRKRGLSDRGIYNVTITGLPIERLIKRYGGVNMAAQQNGKTPYMAITNTGAAGYVITGPDEVRGIEGFMTSDLGDDISVSIIEGMAREALEESVDESGIGRSAIENIRFDIASTGVTIYVEDDPRIKDIRFNISTLLREKINEAKADGLIPQNVDVVTSQGGVDIVAVSKGMAAIQMIKLLKLRRIVLIADSVGTERQPGNDRSLLALTVKDLRDAGIYWDVDLIKIYVGREENAELPSEVILAPQGEKETSAASAVYRDIIRARDEMAIVTTSVSRASTSGSAEKEAAAMSGLLDRFNPQDREALENEIVEAEGRLPRASGVTGAEIMTKALSAKAGGAKSADELRAYISALEWLVYRLSEKNIFPSSLTKKKTLELMMQDQQVPDDSRLLDTSIMLMCYSLSIMLTGQSKHSDIAAALSIALSGISVGMAMNITFHIIKEIKSPISKSKNTVGYDAAAAKDMRLISFKQLAQLAKEAIRLHQEGRDFIVEPRREGRRLDIGIIPVGSAPYMHDPQIVSKARANLVGLRESISKVKPVSTHLISQKAARALPALDGLREISDRAVILDTEEPSEILKLIPPEGEGQTYYYCMVDEIGPLLSRLEGTESIRVTPIVITDTGFDAAIGAILKFLVNIGLPEKEIRDADLTRVISDLEALRLRREGLVEIDTPTGLPSASFGAVETMNTAGVEAVKPALEETPPPAPEQEALRRSSSGSDGSGVSAEDLRWMLLNRHIEEIEALFYSAIDFYGEGYGSDKLMALVLLFGAVVTNETEKKDGIMSTALDVIQDVFGGSNGTNYIVFEDLVHPTLMMFKEMAGFGIDTQRKRQALLRQFYLISANHENSRSFVEYRKSNGFIVNEELEAGLMPWTAITDMFVFDASSPRNTRGRYGLISGMFENGINMLGILTPDYARTYYYDDKMCFRIMVDALPLTLQNASNFLGIGDININVLQYLCMDLLVLREASAREGVANESLNDLSDYILARWYQAHIEMAGEPMYSRIPLHEFYCVWMATELGTYKDIEVLSIDRGMSQQKLDEALDHILPSDINEDGTLNDNAALLCTREEEDVAYLSINEVLAPDSDTVSQLGASMEGELEAGDFDGAKELLIRILTVSPTDSMKPEDIAVIIKSCLTKHFDLMDDILREINEDGGPAGSALRKVLNTSKKLRGYGNHLKPDADPSRASTSGKDKESVIGRAGVAIGSGLAALAQSALWAQTEASRDEILKRDLIRIMVAAALILIPFSIWAWVIPWIQNIRERGEDDRRINDATQNAMSRAKELGWPTSRAPLGPEQIRELTSLSHEWYKFNQLEQALVAYLLTGEMELDDVAKLIVESRSAQAKPPSLSMIKAALAEILKEADDARASTSGTLNEESDNEGLVFLGGAADLQYLPGGAFTGRNSRRAIHDSGLSYVWIGDPKKGRGTAENNHDVALKIQQAASREEGLPPLGILLELNIPEGQWAEDAWKGHIRNELKERLIYFRSHPGSLSLLSIVPQVLDSDGKAVRLSGEAADDVKQTIWGILTEMTNDVKAAHRPRILLRGNTSADGVFIDGNTIQEMAYLEGIIQAIKRKDGFDPDLRGPPVVVVDLTGVYGPAFQEKAESIRKISEQAGDPKKVRVVVLSSDADQRRLGEIVKGRYIGIMPQEIPANIYFGVQNLDREDPEYLKLLKQQGATHVMTGHSETRRDLGVADDDVARQTKLILDAGLIPVVALGEAGRLEGDWETELYQQVRTALGRVRTLEELKRLIIAYEPIFYIGSGQEMSTVGMKQASDIIEKAVKSVMRDLGLEKEAEEKGMPVKLMYGGSEKPSSSYEHGGGWGMVTLLAPLGRLYNYLGALIGTRSVIPGDPERIAERFHENAYAKGKRNRPVTGLNWKMNVHTIEDAARRIDGFQKIVNKNKWRGDFVIFVQPSMIEPLAKRYRGRYAPAEIGTIEWSERQLSINRAIDGFWTWWENNGQNSTINSLQNALDYFLNEIYLKDPALRRWGVSWFRVFEQAMLSNLFSNENTIRAARALALLRYSPLPTAIERLRGQDRDLAEAIQKIVGDKASFHDLTKDDISDLYALLGKKLIPYERVILGAVIPPVERSEALRNIGEFNMDQPSSSRAEEGSRNQEFYMRLLERLAELAEGSAEKASILSIRNSLDAFWSSLNAVKSDKEIEDDVKALFQSGGIFSQDSRLLLDRLSDHLDFENEPEHAMTQSPSERTMWVDEVNFARIWGLEAYLARYFKIRRDQLRGPRDPAVSDSEKEKILKPIGLDPQTSDYEIHAQRPAEISIDVSGVFSGKRHSLKTAATYLVRHALGDKKEWGFDPNNELTLICGIDSEKEFIELVTYVTANAHHGQAAFQIEIQKPYQNGEGVIRFFNSFGEERLIPVREGGFEKQSVSDGAHVVLVTAQDPDSLSLPSDARYRLHIVKPDLDALNAENGNTLRHSTTVTNALRPFFETLEQAYGIKDFHIHYVTPRDGRNLRPLDTCVARGLSWDGKHAEGGAETNFQWEAHADSGSGFAQISLSFDNGRVSKEDIARTLRYAHSSGKPLVYGDGFLPNAENVETGDAPLVIDPGIDVLGDGSQVMLNVWIPNWVQARNVIDAIQKEEAKKQEASGSPVAADIQQIIEARKHRFSAQRALSAAEAPRKIAIFGGDEVVTGELLKQLRGDPSVVVTSIYIEEKTENPLDIDVYIRGYLKQLMTGADIYKGPSGDTMVINGSSPIKVRFGKKQKIPDWKNDGADFVIVADGRSRGNEETWEKHLKSVDQQVIFALDPDRPVQDVVDVAKGLVGRDNVDGQPLVHSNVAMDPYRTKIHETVDGNKRTPSPLLSLSAKSTKAGLQIGSGNYDTHWTAVTLRLKNAQEAEAFREEIRKKVPSIYKEKVCVHDRFSPFTPAHVIGDSLIHLDLDSTMVDGNIVTLFFAYDFAALWASDVLKALQPAPDEEAQQAPVAESKAGVEEKIVEKPKKLVETKPNEVSYIPEVLLKTVPLPDAQSRALRMAIDISELDYNSAERGSADYLSTSFVHLLAGDERFSVSFYGVKDPISFYRGLVKRLPRHVKLHLDFDRVAQQMDSDGFAFLRIESEGQSAEIKIFRNPINEQSLRQDPIDSAILITDKEGPPRDASEALLSGCEKKGLLLSHHVVNPIADSRDYALQALLGKFYQKSGFATYRVISSLPARSSENRLKVNFKRQQAVIQTPQRLEGALHNLQIEFSEEMDQDSVVTALQELKTALGGAIEITEDDISSVDIINNPRAFVISASQINGQGRLWSIPFWAGETGTARRILDEALEKAVPLLQMKNAPEAAEENSTIPPIRAWLPALDDPELAGKGRAADLLFTAVTGRSGKLTLWGAIGNKNIHPLGVTLRVVSEERVKAAARALNNDSIYGEAGIQFEYGGWDPEKRVFVIWATNGKEWKRLEVYQGEPNGISDQRMQEWKRKGCLPILLHVAGSGYHRFKEKGWLEKGFVAVVYGNPGKGANWVFIPGLMDPQDENILQEMEREEVLSQGSCTSGGMGIAASVLDEETEFVAGVTDHEATNDQMANLGPLHDAVERTLRAAGMLLSSSGAGTTVSKVVKTFAGRIAYRALREGVGGASVAVVVHRLKKGYEGMTVERVKEKFRQAAGDPLKQGIFAVHDAPYPLDSEDVKGNTHSSIVDLNSVIKVGRFVIYFAWYDNEAAFSKRLGLFGERIAIAKTPKNPETPPVDEKAFFAPSFEEKGIKLIEIVKRGEQVTLFKALDPLGQTFGVKVVHYHGATDYVYPNEEEIRELIRRLGGDEHPNVEKARETGTIRVGQNDYPFVIVDLLPGQNLKDTFTSAFEEQPVTFQRRLRWINGLMEGYRFLKEKGIKLTEANLKNVVLGNNDEATHIDFLSFQEAREDYADNRIAELFVDIASGRALSVSTQADVQRRIEYSKDRRAIMEGLLGPSYGEQVPAGLAELIQNYLQSKEGYHSASEVYEKLNLLEPPANQPNSPANLGRPAAEMSTREGPLPAGASETGRASSSGAAQNNVSALSEETPQPTDKTKWLRWVNATVVRKSAIGKAVVVIGSGLSALATQSAVWARANADTNAIFYKDVMWIMGPAVIVILPVWLYFWVLPWIRNIREHREETEETSAATRSAVNRAKELGLATPQEHSVDETRSSSSGAARQTGIVIGVVGVSEEAVSRINAKSAGVKVVGLTEADEEANLKVLEAARRTYHAYASGIVQTGITDEGDLTKVIDELRNSIEEKDRDLFAITNPDVAALNSETIGRIADVAGALNKIVERMPAIHSFRASELSVYELRIDNIAAVSRVQINDAEIKTRLSDMRERGITKVASFRVSNVAELRWLANEHRQAREKYGKDKYPVKLHIRCADKNVNKENIDRVLRLAGADDVITGDDVVFEDGETLNGIYELVKLRYGDIDPKDVAVGDTRGLSGDGESLKNMLYVQIQDSGDMMLSQTYTVIIGLIANDNNLLTVTRDDMGELIQMNLGLYCFVFKPIKKFDTATIRKEIDQYEKVLMAA